MGRPLPLDQLSMQCNRSYDIHIQQIIDRKQVHSTVGFHSSRSVNRINNNVNLANLVGAPVQHSH